MLSLTNWISKYWYGSNKEVTPHNYEAILKDADEDFHFKELPLESLYKKLHEGVFLNQKRQKYWVDKETGSNCFMLYARDLNIAWGEKKDYWSWSSEPETSDVLVEVANIRDLSWLKIQASFDTGKLTPGSLYQVSFVIKKDQNVNGWDEKVILQLNCPDGTTQQKYRSFEEIRKDEWIKVRVGTFLVPQKDTKDLEVIMSETISGKSKTGLSVRGVIIEAKKQHLQAICTIL